MEGGNTKERSNDGTKGAKKNGKTHKERPSLSPKVRPKLGPSQKVTHTTTQTKVVEDDHPAPRRICSDPAVGTHKCGAVQTLAVPIWHPGVRVGVDANVPTPPQYHRGMREYTTSAQLLTHETTD